MLNRYASYHTVGVPVLEYNVKNSLFAYDTPLTPRPQVSRIRRALILLASHTTEPIRIPP